MNNEYYTYIGALRVFNDFSCQTDEYAFSYDYNAPEYDNLRMKYRIDKVAGNGSELDKALNLMQWCSENILHNGGTKDVEFIPKTSVDILDYAFQKGREYGVYCRLQAIVFTECCLALGIKSRILHCLPFSPNDFDTHVVSMVYISDMAKWIMLDASNNRYFVNSDKTILSPMEIRSKLAYNDNIECNVPDDNYKMYMAKNMFYFKSPQINTFGSDLLTEQKTIYCIPCGFDVLEREIAYCQYAIKNTSEEFAQDWKRALSTYQKRTSIDCLPAKLFFA